MLRRVLLLLLVLVLLVPLFAVSADVTSFTYTVSASDPSLPDSFGTSTIPCAMDDDNAAFYYRLVEFQVSATGTYEIVDLRFSDTSVGDGMIAIYNGDFDSGSPLANCIANVDDGPLNVPLTGGQTYTMLQTTYSPDATGSFGFSVDGPGELSFVTGSADSDLGPPCNNLFDGRINDDQALDCAAPVAVYLVDGQIDVYAIHPDTGAGALVIRTAAHSAEATAEPGSVEPSGNILLASANNPANGALISLYWLPATGEYLLHTTYSDGKAYEIVWSTADDLRHTAA